MGGHRATGGELTAVIEHLMQSGFAVSTHGETMAQAHTQSDAVVETAAAGWRGRSAEALLARSQEWSAATAAFLVRLGAHADGLHTCSQAFAHMTAEHAASIQAAHPGSPSGNHDSCGGDGT